jgi:hypothetical protein
VEVVDEVGVDICGAMAGTVSGIGYSSLVKARGHFWASNLIVAVADR